MPCLILVVMSISDWAYFYARLKARRCAFSFFQIICKLFCIHIDIFRSEAYTISYQVFWIWGENIITTYDDQVKVFKAFCDEKRLRILELLRSGEKCACVLIEQLDMPQSSLSYHMKILCESGIVDSRPEGKWIYYTICEKGGGEAMALLKELLTLEAITEESNCCL